MAKATFTYAEQEGSWPKHGLVVETDLSHTDSLQKVATSLTSAIDQRVSLYKENAYQHFPIKIALPNCISCSESTFWRLLLENTDTACSYIEKYVARHVYATNIGVLEDSMWSSEDRIAGSDAVFELVRYSFSEKLNQERAARVFLSYIDNLCDLEFEVDEDLYFSTILGSFGEVSEPLYLEILHRRLFQGQYSLASRTYQELEQWLCGSFSKDQPRFSEFITYLAQRKRANGNEYLTEQHILELATVAYGSELGAVQDVLDYYNRMSGENAKSQVIQRGGFSEHVSWNADQLRLSRIGKNRSWHTGFHELNTSTGKWVGTEKLRSFLH